MKRINVVVGFLTVASLLSACAPNYQTVRTAGVETKIVTRGILVAQFRGPLNLEVMDLLPNKLRQKGFSATDSRLSSNPNASLKLEGDLVAEATNEPRPTKILGAEARLVDLKTGKVMLRYVFRAKNAAEVRTPELYANDIANLIANDVVQQ